MTVGYEFKLTDKPIDVQAAIDRAATGRATQELIRELFAPGGEEERMSKFKTDIGHAMKIARVRAKLKQSEMAEKLGVTATYVSLLETNKRNPSWEIIMAVAEIADEPVSELMHWGEEF